MSDTRVFVGSTSVPRLTADGGLIGLRGSRDGSAIVLPWYQALVNEVRVFAANAGSVTTPITWGATATIDVTKPIIWLSVPTSVIVIPLYIMIYMEAFGTNAQFECNAQVGTGGARTSGGTAITIKNLRSDAPNASSCTAYQGDNTPVFVGSTTNVAEFFRSGQQFAITKTTASATAAVSDPNRFEWLVGSGLVAPVVKGGGQIALHQGSQAGTGFAQLIFAELPSEAV